MAHVTSRTVGLTALIAALIVCGVSACAAPRAPKTVSMRMTGSPPDASVTIDDIFVGRLDLVAARGVALPEGTHRVSVEAPGYFPWDSIVEAKRSKGPVRLDVSLVAIPE